ncbi:MAG: glycosyltransferase involved in cell wall biosynthesis, partial [Myxococcota bacterium]
GCRLRLVGDGPDLEDLHSLARALGVNQRVDFVGRVPHAMVPRELSQIDVYCALSREESFGVAIVEAMAGGRPVIVSDAPGPNEITENGAVGRVVPRGSHLEAAEAMLHLVQRPDEWERLSELGVAHARQHYEWHTNVEQQLEVYRQLVR